MWRSEDILWRLVLSIHYIVSKNLIQVVSFENKHLTCWAISLAITFIFNKQLLKGKQEVYCDDFLNLYCHLSVFTSHYVDKITTLTQLSVIWLQNYGAASIDHEEMVLLVKHFFTNWIIISSLIIERIKKGTLRWKHDKILPEVLFYFYCC